MTIHRFKTVPSPIADESEVRLVGLKDFFSGFCWSGGLASYWDLPTNPCTVTVCVSNRAVRGSSVYKAFIIENGYIKIGGEVRMLYSKTMNHIRKKIGNDARTVWVWIELTTTTDDRTSP